MKCSFLILFNLVVLTAYPFLANAQISTQLGKLSDARKVQAKLQDSVLSVEGASIGITGCDPLTGAQRIEGTFSHCVIIVANSEVACVWFEKRYPTGTRVDDVFIHVAYSGPANPKSRVPNQCKWAGWL